MTRHPSQNPGHVVPSSAIIWQIALTFAITWAIAGSYIFFPETASGLFGELSGLHPLYFLATWAPAIAGLTVVFVHGGMSGLRSYLGRMALWRCDPVWWIFILAGIPLIFMAGSLLKGGPLIAPLPPQGASAAFAILAVMLFLGPVEELGWRGVALPILQRYVSPVFAGAAIGVIWGLWHLPAFYLASTVYADWSFLPFFIGNVTLAILVTPIFNAARGSILLPMLFHWQLINPFWPDAQPWDTWILVGVTVVVVWWKRASLFRRGDAVTDVIPSTEPATTRRGDVGLQA
ncbi:type II CAAX endopeptidase family protein [Tropicimonas sp. IMCC6043]|uniref:type II CAAX endopeptidase family protein n=1 Tax=Tropicimonas sp. IMCC6043 TaxID=2510645 RepID=UPI00101D62EE|nr:type II CAAX endopeptidase family protein [Tropicimonas sp. IMCC6043]RYH11531.1 CPBP family intramembrane metalloprotease [Tropicimonas sp. IMCC6043]